MQSTYVRTLWIEAMPENIPNIVETTANIGTIRFTMLGQIAIALALNHLQIAT